MTLLESDTNVWLTCTTCAHQYEGNAPLRPGALQKSVIRHCPACHHSTDHMAALKQLPRAKHQLPAVRSDRRGVKPAFARPQSFPQRR